MAIAKTLKAAFNVADPVQPLPPGDPRYVDCTPVRGNEDRVGQMLKHIIWADDFTTQLFTGHRGSGKSTELLRLQADLQQRGYVVLYFQANEDLDLNNIEYTDLLLSIARRITGGLSSQGIKLPDTLLEDVEEWFRETLYAEDQWRQVDRELKSDIALGVGLPENMPLVARLLARLTGQIKTGRAIRTEIRRKLDSQISRLIDNLNKLLDAANIEAKKQGKSGLVLIIDNLDRMVLRDFGDGRDNYKALYVEHGDQLIALHCHIIYTVPISLMYSQFVTVVENVFPINYILPMIKVHNRQNQPFSDGLAYMRRILAARIDLQLLFSSEAVDYICKASGGHPRDLIRMVRQSCGYASMDHWPQPITLDVVKRAEGKLVTTYSRMIVEEYYPLLAHVYWSKTVRNDPNHQILLQNLSILEYINGTPPWHDVHPAVLHLSKFQDALKNIRKELGIDVGL